MLMELMNFIFLDIWHFLGTLILLSVLSDIIRIFTDCLTNIILNKKPNENNKLKEDDEDYDD